MTQNQNIKARLNILLSLIYRNHVDYNPIDMKEYLGLFGVVQKKGKYIIKDQNKLEQAYSKAWEIRNFEIDKFWTRAAYFWGFIVLIFGGYITVLTSENNKLALDYRLDLYFLVLGLIFSIAWYLVIRGSKSWQQNWEGHIDNLENFVSGPIYKTIYYSGIKFYSVSKINEVLSIIVSLVWTALTVQYYYSNFTIGFSNLDFQATFSVFGAVGFIMSLRFGYCLGGYKTKKNHFIDRWD